MTVPNTLCRLDDKIFDHLVSVACNPGGGGHIVPVTKLDEWYFNLLVYIIKNMDNTSHPIEMNGINRILLFDVEDHRTLEKTHEKILVTIPRITQSSIDKNVDVMWYLVHEHLEYIHDIHRVPILWCTP